MDEDATCYEAGLGPGDIALDGDPAPLHGKGHSPPTFWPMSIVAKRSHISATAWGVAEAKCILVTRVCMFVCLSLVAFPPDPDVTWGNGRMCPLVVYYLADLQSVHEFRCYDNIAPNAKCQRVLVLALCLVSSCDRELYLDFQK